MSGFLLPYSQGTISVVNGEVEVTGVATAFQTEVRSGDLLECPPGAFQALGAGEVTNTTFQLLDGYAGETASDVPYKIHRVSRGWGDASRVNLQLADIITGLRRGYAMTSLTPIEIGAGEHVFVVNSALSLLPGVDLKFSSRANPDTHWIIARLVSLVGQTLTVEAVSWAGSGERADWNINVTGLTGDITPELEAARDAAIAARDDAQSARDAAAISADGASGSKDDAEAAATAAIGVRTVLQSYILTPKAADPTMDDNGDPLQVGTRYFNTTTESERIYKLGGSWENYTGAEGIASLVEDTSPQLGGDLDLNGHSIPAINAQFDAVAAQLVTVGNDLSNRIRADAGQSFSASEKAQARSNIYAAPFDAMAYHGLQVNGFQQISQENGNSAVTTSLAYPVDNERITFVGSMAVSAKRIESSPFASRADITRAVELEITTADTSVAAGDYLLLDHTIEGERLRGRLAWGTAAASPIRISRVLRANVSGRFYAVVRNGAANRSYVHAFDLVANTDTYVSFSVPGDTSGTWAVDSTLGLLVRWVFMAGSTFHTTADAWQASTYLAASDISNFAATVGNKVWFGPMVVLPGLQAPTFAEIMQCQRMPDDELRSCLRYWELVPVFWDAAASFSFPIAYFAAEKRATPTLTATIPSGTGGTAIPANSAPKRAIIIATANSVLTQGHVVANARL